MNRCSPLVLVALLILGAPVSGFPDDPGVARRLQELGDPDPRVRENAFHDLRRAGFAARTQVFQATFSDNPQVRAAASEVLMRMTWVAPDDSPQLRQRLIDYGTQPEKARRDLGIVLATERQEASLRVALRIIAEDQSSSVAWAVAQSIDPGRMEHAGALIEKLDLTFARAPILSLAARYYLPKDREKALAMLRRAIEIDPPGEVYDSDPLEWAFDRLVLDRVLRGAYQEAAELRRAQDHRTRFAEGVNARVLFHLFALHARFGPLDGLVQDLEDHSSRLCDPGILYALSRMYDRCDMPLAARALSIAAMSTGRRDSQQRNPLPPLLESCDWFDFAEWELMRDRAAYRESGDEFQVVNANLQLSAVLERAGRYARAADTLDEATKFLADMGRSAVRTNLLGESELLGVGELTALSHFYRFKDAARANDQERMIRHADAILALRPMNDAIAVEVVPFLQSIGRQSDADALFALAEGSIRKLLDQHPSHAGIKNELAWLLARTDRNLKEAYALARSAVEMEPENASFIDTLAEAAFRNGFIDEAIARSRQSIELRPNYPFFRRQLARFQDAASSRPGN